MSAIEVLGCDSWEENRRDLQAWPIRVANIDDWYTTTYIFNEELTCLTGNYWTVAKTLQQREVWESVYELRVELYRKQTAIDLDCIRYRLQECCASLPNLKRLIISGIDPQPKLFCSCHPSAEIVVVGETPEYDLEQDLLIV